MNNGSRISQCGSLQAARVPEIKDFLGIGHDGSLQESSESEKKE